MVTITVQVPVSLDLAEECATLVRTTSRPLACMLVQVASAIMDAHEQDEPSVLARTGS